MENGIMKLEDTYAYKYIPNCENTTIEILPLKIWNKKYPGKPPYSQYSKDRNVIEITELAYQKDEHNGWLVHEVGHALAEQKNKRLHFINEIEKYKPYPHNEIEKVAWYYQFKYLIEKNLSKKDIIQILMNYYQYLWNEEKNDYFNLFIDMLLRNKT